MIGLNAGIQRFKTLYLRIICVCLWICMTTAQATHGDDLGPDDLANTIPGSPIWNTASDHPEGFDWIQLTSGEWLKGDFRVLYDDKLEFDSDNLELLEIDWEDVQEVRCHSLHSIRMEGHGTVIGFLRIVGNKIYITTGETVLEFDRSRLISIAYGEPKEIGYWVSRISLGLDIRTGNTDQLNYNASAMAKRRTSLSRFSIDYLGILSQTDGAETANSQRISSFYDILKARKLYWRLVFAEYFMDRFSNIDHRITIGTGIVYRIIDTSKTDWEIGPGIAYQNTQNVSVEADQSSSNSTPAFVLGTTFDTELTRKIDFDASYQLNIISEESGRYTHHATAGLSFELTDRLDLGLSLIWDYIQYPRPAADGQVPDSDDFYLFFGIGFEL